MLEQPQTDESPAPYQPAFPLGRDAWVAPPPAASAQDVGARNEDTSPLVGVIALSALLYAPMAAGEALTGVLRSGHALLPDAVAFRLYITAGDRRRPFRLVASSSRAAPDQAPQARAAHALVATLGFGAGVDARAHTERGVIETPRASVYPLARVSGELRGVLVAEDVSAHVSATAGALLAIIANHAMVLLDRLDEERIAERATRALRALRAPRPDSDATRADTVEAARASVPQGAPAAAARILAATAPLLAEVLDAPAAVALPLEDDASLRLLDDAPGRPVRIAARRAHDLLAPLRHANVLLVTASLHQRMWSALARVRRFLTTRMAHAPVALLVAAVRCRAGIAGLVVVGIAESAAGVRQLDVRWHVLLAGICACAGERLDALRAAEGTVAQAQAFDSFLSLAAHELRSPLTSVKGYAQLLTRQSRKQGVPQPILRSASAIEQQAERLAEMIDELHDAARIRRGCLELIENDVDLVAVVRQLVERWRTRNPECTVALTVEVESLRGRWDAHRVTQIVRDLLDNAARYTPDGAPIALRLARDESLALLRVRDGGIGIGASDRERIFNYLYRAPIAEQRNLAGLGLGLFVSRNLAERHGGRLWLAWTATSGQTGSEFCLTLPLVAQP